MTTVKVRNLVIGEGIPKICVPIVGKTKEEIDRQAQEIRKVSADIVEWRVDWFESWKDLASVEEVLRHLREILADCPILFTFRTEAEGGASAITPEAYVALNLMAVRLRLADLIDVEVALGEEVVRTLLEAAHANQVKVIGSNHEFHHTPDKDEMIRRLCRMQSLGVDLPKLAVMPENVQDVLALLGATEEMTRLHADRPIVTMSMAGKGVISRMSGEIFGSAITFGTVGQASAPGQMEVEQMKMILKTIHESL